MADGIGHGEGASRTDLKKVSEVLAEFLKDILLNWRSERPTSCIGRFLQYFVAWLGAFHLAFPAFLMNYSRLIEGYFDPGKEPQMIVSGLVVAGAYSLLPALLIGANVRRQTSVRIYLAGFFLAFTTWALVGRFAPQTGGS